MTTSQKDTVNMMDGVPMAVLDDNKRVIAVITWINQEDGIVEFIFAYDKHALRLLPRVGDNIDFDQWAVKVSRSGKLVDYYEEVVRTHESLLSVDDCRPGNSYSYLIYSGERVATGPWIEPGHVYQLEVDSEPGEPSNPRLETAEEVLALAELPEAVHVRNIPKQLSGARWDDPSVIDSFGDLSGSLRINHEWDIGRSQELFSAS